MDYRFEISLPDSSSFRCEIAIGGEQTFQQLHDKIVETLNYDSSQLASFFTIDKLGNRKQEIALMEMAVEEDESGALVMDNTKISDIIKPGCLELEYVFDFFSNKYFKVEYAGEYVKDSSDILPLCLSCEGDIPEQFSYNDESDKWAFSDSDDGEYDSYDDSFMDEFGDDGFSGDDEDTAGDDDYYRDDRYESLDDYIDRL